MEAKPVVLTDKQIEEIAIKAAAKALELVYADVGRSVVKAAMWIIGSAVLALLAYLGATGKLK